VASAYIRNIRRVGEFEFPNTHRDLALTAGPQSKPHWINSLLVPFDSEDQETRGSAVTSIL
jgi:hypothetical protein